MRVGATHLLPNIEQEDESYTVLTLLAGVTVGLLIVLPEHRPFQCVRRPRKERGQYERKDLRRHVGLAL